MSIAMVEKRCKRYGHGIRSYKEEYYAVMLKGEEIGRITYHSESCNGSYYCVSGADGHHIGNARLLFKAKLMAVRSAGNINAKKMKVEQLTDGDDPDFYPTPKKLAGQMFGMLNVKKLNCCSVLEPSAGKGDLIEAFKAFCPGYSKNGEYGEIDCIERDRNLQFILKGKGERVVHDDFLTFNSRKAYGLVIMNPPFSEGDKHLLHAVELMRGGGQIVCLLNAETLRNAYTNTRYQLRKEIEQYKARVRYVKGAFTQAERKTGVDVAIVYFDIPQEAPEDPKLFEHLHQASGVNVDEAEANSIASADPIENLVQTFNAEVDASLAFFKRYNSLVPYIRCADTKDASPLIRISIANRDYGSIDASAVNRFLRTVRSKYWNKLFDNRKLTDRFTSNILETYRRRVDELANYDFTKFNIQQVLEKLDGELLKGVEDSIMALFEKLSYEHSWYPECANNRHYFNGWKTNKAHKVGMKSIIPTYGAFSSYDHALDRWQCYQLLADLEKTLVYLDNGAVDLMHLDLGSVLDVAVAKGQTKNIDFTYFSATFYKKGTCHIKFHEEARILIDRLNIFASRHEAWLPPCYGKKRYEDLDEEEKAVIDDFQGREEYEKVVDNKDYYLVEGGVMLLTE